MKKTVRVLEATGLEIREGLVASREEVGMFGRSERSSVQNRPFSGSEQAEDDAVGQEKVYKKGESCGKQRDGDNGPGEAFAKR